jgi:hypothetical protein
MTTMTLPKDVERTEAGWEIEGRPLRATPQPDEIRAMLQRGPIERIIIGTQTWQRRTYVFARVVYQADTPEGVVYGIGKQGLNLDPDTALLVGRSLVEAALEAGAEG